MANMRIRKGDKVRVISGKDRGVEGDVTKAFPKDHTVVVQKVAMARKAVMPTTENPRGGIIDIERPIDVSNVMLVCPECGETTRVGITKDEDGNTHRVCKKCDERID